MMVGVLKNGTVDECHFWRKQQVTETRIDAVTTRPRPSHVEAKTLQTVLVLDILHFM